MRVSISRVRVLQRGGSTVCEICGFPSIDVFNFTHALVHQLPTDAANMTWDGQHWARSVNVIKAQHILYSITSKSGSLIECRID